MAGRFRKGRTEKPKGRTTPGRTDAAPAAGTGTIGRVVTLFSAACQVDAGGELLDCVLPSALARRQQSSVAVGDWVRCLDQGADRLRVEEVLPRRTVLARPDPQNPRLERVLAANVDVVVIVVAFREPALQPALIDRFLILVERGGARPLLVVNKLDLADETLRRASDATLEPYRELGVEVHACCALSGSGIEPLRASLAGSTVVLAGHSGVGKSSLLNALAGELRAEVGRVAAWSGKGRHTTTRSRLFRLPGEVDLIDTPGIRELGLFALDLAGVRACFPELSHYAEACRFNDCSHRTEPGCGVRSAVETGELSAARYATYLRLCAELKNPR